MNNPEVNSPVMTPSDIQDFMFNETKKYYKKSIFYKFMYHFFTVLMIGSLMGAYIFVNDDSTSMVKYATIFTIFGFIVGGIFSFRAYNHNKMYFKINMFICNGMKDN